MQKAAQSSQLKNGNLGGGRVYAFRVSRINADFVSLKLWLLGGVIRARNIAVAALPDFIAQIDAALADGCEVVAPDGAEFSAPEKVLSGIRKEFSSYCCLGASDAKHALGGVATPTKPQASARAVEPAARQISDSEPTPTSKRQRFPRSYVRRNSKIAKIAAESIGSAFRDELEPVLDALDDIGAMLSELLAAREIDRAPKQPLGWRKCTVENPLGAAIRTKCGRTSVVVGVRNVAKFQPKTKGKSK